MNFRNKKIFDPSIVHKLYDMLYTHNTHAKNFLMVRQRLNQGSVRNLKLVLISNKSTDGRVYNQPTISEVTALIVVMLTRPKKETLLCRDNRDY